MKLRPPYSFNLLDLFESIKKNKKGCELDMNKYFYIYNFEQSQFFIQNGLEVLEIGKGKFGDIFHKFLRDDKANEVFDKWVRRIK
jgi:hypothetical protein